jgi:hypothetical protein
VTVRASGPGRARVSGSRLTTTIRQLAAAGNYTLVVPLGKKARALRRTHRKFKVTGKVSLTPAWGSASSAKISRTLGK